MIFVNVLKWRGVNGSRKWNGACRGMQKNPPKHLPQAVGSAGTHMRPNRPAPRREMARCRPLQLHCCRECDLFFLMILLVFLHWCLPAGLSGKWEILDNWEACDCSKVQLQSKTFQLKKASLIYETIPLTVHDPPPKSFQQSLSFVTNVLIYYPDRM